MPSWTLNRFWYCGWRRKESALSRETEDRLSREVIRHKVIVCSAQRADAECFLCPT